jgi:hypothetical protein
MIKPVLKKIDALREKTNGQSLLDSHMLGQIRAYFRIGKGISDAIGGVKINQE